MRTLYLMRHAKSDWDASYVGDHERPLSTRGLKAARRMGKFLFRTDELPEQILCSSAVRTRQTLEVASTEGGWPEIPVSVENELYLTSQERILARLRALDDQTGSAMIIGHEPTTSVVAGSLIGSASIRVPTAACSRIDLYVESWGDVRPGCGTLEWHVTPKTLKKGARK